MSQPCGWTVGGCGCGADCWDTHTPAVQEHAAALAAAVIWAATGRRYGLCELTVQPCRRPRVPSAYAVYPLGREMVDAGWTLGPDDALTEAGCGAGCSCRGRCEAVLEGPTTTARVTQVTVAGEVVPAGAYQVHDGYLLVRVDGQCWPVCADYGQQDPPGFAVTYTRGTPIPASIQAAYDRLACEYARACTGADCRLPARLASLSRQGVEVTVAAADDPWADLRTGVAEVDAAIAADNPHRLASRPRVLSPDLPPPRVVT